MEIKKDYTTIDEYIDTFPEEVQKILRKLRIVIKEAAPDAVERISYRMPTFFQEGNLVHFAAFKNHIGFYPAPTGIQAFTHELSAYEQSKGAIRFPIDKSLPYEVIEKIVRFRVSENLKKAEEKKMKKR